MTGNVKLKLSNGQDIERQPLPQDETLDMCEKGYGSKIHSVCGTK